MENMTKEELSTFRRAVMETVDKKTWAKICERQRELTEAKTND
jgi:hypothetical protein